MATHTRLQTHFSFWDFFGGENNQAEPSERRQASSCFMYPVDLNHQTDCIECFSLPFNKRQIMLLHPIKTTTQENSIPQFTKSTFLLIRSSAHCCVIQGKIYGSRESSRLTVHTAISALKNTYIYLNSL